MTILAVLASLLVPSPPARADQPLHAFLDYSILAQPYENSVQLNMSGLFGRIAVDRDPSSPYYGTIYAGFGETESQTNVSFTIKRSLDGGLTFGDPIVSYVCPSSNSSCWYQRPDIAVGAHGVVYIASGPTVLRSIDQGLSWETVASFTTFGSSASVSADDATGSVYVGNVNSSDILQVTRSIDDGQTWNPPVSISRGATGAIPHVAAFRDMVVAAFLSGNGSPASVTVAASHDGGLTWPTINPVSAQTLCSGASPSVSVSPDGIFAVSWYAPVNGTGCYWEGGGDTLATLVSVSRDNGSSFSSPIEVSRYSGGANIGFGDALAFDNRSRLYVAWHSFDILPNGTSVGSVFVSTSSDLGQNFTSASFHTTPEGGGANTSSYEQLVSGLNSRVYLMWIDFRGAGFLLRGVSGEAFGDVATVGQSAPAPIVDVQIVDRTTHTVEARATWTGSRLLFAELPPSEYDVWISIGNATTRAGAMPVQTWNTTSFTVRVEGGFAGPGPPPFPWATSAVAGVVVFVGAAIAVLHHTRLVREQVLQRKVRLLLYEAIRKAPGSSFTELRDTLGLQNGVTAYHLRVLEKQGLVHTRRGRRHRWYYPDGDVSLWRDLPLSPLQKTLVDWVHRDPGIGIRELARSMNRHHASVAYNVKGLAREGLLRTQRTGRKVHCFPVDGSGTD